MKAKEMFKELGYEMGHFDAPVGTRIWLYEKEENEIFFYINLEEWTIYLESGEWENIDKITKAINKQIEELGWDKDVDNKKR